MQPIIDPELTAILTILRAVRRHRLSVPPNDDPPPSPPRPPGAPAVRRSVKSSIRVLAEHNDTVCLISQRHLAAAKLGADDPESWARSQINEGIPQLARFLFLRQAWKLIIDEDDEKWIDIYRAPAAKPNEPGAGIGPALNRLLSSGANKKDITEVVRVMQWELLFCFCYLLEDPGDVEDEVRDLGWALFQVNEEGEPIVPINGLHESVLEMDPTGREMRPK